MAEIHNLLDYTAPDTIPDELKSIPAWLVWRLVHKPGKKKPSKVPFYTNGALRSGNQGSAEDRAQLVTYPVAVAACVKGQFSGVGMAILPENNVIALDFDNCVTDGKIDAKLIAELPCVTYTEYSPSGTGVRAFMRGSLPSRKNTEHPTMPVEFFGNNGFVTVTGNMIEDCALFGTEKVVCDLTPEVKALFVERFGAVSVGGAQGTGVMDDNDAWLLSLSPTLGWSREELKGYLFDCIATCSRQVWVDVLMAVHHESAGEDWALELCVEWSATGDNFAGRKDVEGRWKSFGRNRGANPIGGARLLAYRAECLTKKRYSEVDAWKTKIKAAGSEFELREGIAPKIKRDGALGNMEREALAQAFLEAFKGLGTKYPIATCRKLIAVDRVRVTISDSDDLDAQRPEWARGWMYVTETDQWYNASEFLSVQGFNMRFNRYMPRNEEGNVTMSASVYCSEHLQNTVVAGVRYMPTLLDTYTQNGALYANTYRHDLVPLANLNLSAKAKKSVELWLYHMKHVLCGGRDREFNFIMSYISHCVRFPGRKIRHAIIVKGIEGDGKSIIGALMAAIMGRENVRVIGPAAVASQFNGWAEGACVGIFEELRMPGHNRHDAHNALKPLITNDTVDIHRKGRDPYNILNTMNYWGFTNYFDTLPLQDTDRRYTVLHLPFSTYKELNDLLAPYGGAEAYFNMLFESLHEHAGELRNLFLNWQMSPDFNPNGRALDTQEKASMVAMECSDEETILREILDEGGPGILSNALLTNSLAQAWQLHDTTAQMPVKRALGILLGKLGWVKHPSRVWFNGMPSYLWTRGLMGVEWSKVRVLLDKTVSHD